MDSALELELTLRGAAPAAELATALKVSQPTISRRLARLGSRIVRVGKGRSTHYALAREIPPLGSSWPLYRIDEQGRPHRAGTLRALQKRQWVFEPWEPWPTLTGGDGDFPNGLFPDLPWFLDDLRPQGFLGRAFARNYGKRLHLPPDPVRWNADDVLRALVQYGSDLPGSWVIGEAMLAEAQSASLSPPNFIHESERESIYPRLAEAALAGQWPGSSAGGEQPKFTARVGSSPDDLRHVIVKFSGNQNRREDERWADLLLAEHIAAQLLIRHGIPAARTEILRAGNRVFLESSRFDRIGTCGRRAMASLAALDAAFFGEPSAPWTAAALRLQSGGWFTREDADNLQTLWWFGSLIGNTDMHYGNTSVFLNPSRPLELAPSYDMLPMLYRPDPQGGLVDRLVTPVPPPPEAASLRGKASEMALEFFGAVADSPEMTSPFREIGRRNYAALERMEAAWRGTRGGR